MSKKIRYATNHPETNEVVYVEKGGKVIPNWVTWIDYGKGFQHCGFSRATDHAAAEKAPRSTNPYGKRFAATPIQGYTTA